MATNKNIRTPLIKPRTQGGTFYSFGSSMEDIGLNINDTINKVALSHYVLLDIPEFDSSTFNTMDYSDPELEPHVVGDKTFAEFFQNTVLNMETVIRNKNGYNYANEKTVSERVFWKSLFKAFGKSVDSSTGYYAEHTEPNETTIVKCMGRISSGSQRSDEYGIYNETFVQIPSSYGATPILFKKVNDENYSQGKSYEASNTDSYIEGISQDDVSAGVIKSTGISPNAHYDSGKNYVVDSSCGNLEVIFDPTVYGAESFDDLAINSELGDEFSFNAILVYYSIYDTNTNAVLATNAFGLYILDESIKTTGERYKFGELVKKRGTATSIGTSFSFRLNIKPSSAYSGDVVIYDESSTAFSESTDFNDIVRNLSEAVSTLRSNAMVLYKISSNNETIKNAAISALNKIDDFEKDINNLKLERCPNYWQLWEDAQEIDSTLASSIINKAFKISTDSNGYPITIINKDADLTEAERNIVEKLLITDGEKQYYDVGKVMSIILAKIKA